MLPSLERPRRPLATARCHAFDANSSDRRCLTAKPIENTVKPFKVTGQPLARSRH